jgi:hypothetical protein
MYAYCGDADAFERSRYFGMSKDIYQMDHFMAAFVQSLPGFTDLKAYDVKSSRELPDGRVEVEVTVQGQHAKADEVRARLMDIAACLRADAAAFSFRLQTRDWVFIMRKATIGVKTGCWVTHRVLAADSQFRGVV